MSDGARTSGRPFSCGHSGHQSANAYSRRFISGRSGSVPAGLDYLSASRLGSYALGPGTCDSHLVGILQVLVPCALGRRKLAAVIRAKATIAVFGRLELGQEHTGPAVQEPGRPLVLEDSGRLE